MARHRSGKDLHAPFQVYTRRTSVRRPRPASASIRDDRGRKQCSQCRSWLPESDYHKQSNASDGLKAACKTCTSKQQKKCRDGHDYNHPARKHHVSRAWYDKAIGNGCEICGAHGKLTIDHDHRCCPGFHSCGKCVRGILCISCNLGIGNLGDDIDRVMRVAQYLAKGYPGDATASAGEWKRMRNE